MATSVEILLKAKDLASASIRKVGRGVAGLAQKAGLAKPEIDRFSKANKQAATGTDKLGSSLGRTVGRITAFLSVTLLLAKAKDAFLAVTSTGAKFETLQTQLDAVTGSAKAGEQAFAWIQTFAKDTPLQLDEVTDGFVKLKSFGIDPMNGSYQALVDQSSKLGGGQEKLNGIILAVGQAWAKQKLQAEETLQLVERGVPVYDLLSKALGKTSQQIVQMSADGELGRDAIAALIAEMGSSSLGAAADQMKDATGIVSNLKDQFVEFLNEIADQGVLSYFKSELTQLSSKFKEMASDGSLKDLARNISDFMIKGAEYTKAFITTIISFSSELKTLAIAMVAVKFGSFLQNLAAVAPAAIAAAAGVKRLSLALVATGWGAVALGIGYVISKLVELKNITIDTEQTNLRTAAANAELADIYEKLTEKLGVHIGSTQDLRQAQEDGLIVFDETTKQFERVKTAIEGLQQAQDDYMLSIGNFNAEMANNANQVKIAKDAGEAFKVQVDEMKASSEGLAGSISKLTDDAFVKFIQGSKLFAESAFISDIEKAGVQVAVLDESFKRLNVDTELFKSGMSSAGKEAIESFNFIANTANVSAEIIKESFDSALASVSTQAGFDRLKTSIEDLGKEGTLSGYSVTEALNKIKEAATLANEALGKMTSSIGAAGTVAELDAVGLAAATAMDAGKITAEEYLVLMDKVAEKKSALVKKTQEQIDKEKELKGAIEETSDDVGNAADEEAKIRTVLVQQTEEQTDAVKRQGEATTKAMAVMQASTQGIIRGAKAIRSYFGNVTQLADKYAEASASADKMAASVMELADNGKASEQQMAGYVSKLESAIRGGENLDEQSLSQLQSALDAAKSKMIALRDEARGAASEVASLESELAGLNGDKQRVQELQFTQRRRDIEQKITDAKLEGNTDAVASYEKSLSLLLQINQQKSRAISVENSASQNGANLATNQADKTVRIKFESPQGRVVNATVAEKDSANLIQVLQESGAATR